MPHLVLDAWAIMAWLKGQSPASERVRLLLDATDRGDQKLFMNIVNLGEIFYLSSRAKNVTYGERVLISLQARIAIVSASDELVMRAARLKAAHTISYADAFAAATAIVHQLPLVTGDPELRTMAEREKTLKLHWIAG